MRPRTPVVRRWWCAVALAGCALSLPVAGASEPLAGQITTGAPLGLYGDVSWQALGPVLAMTAFPSGPFTLEAIPVDGTLHIWKWNRTVVDIGPSRHQGNVDAGQDAVPLNEVQAISLALGPQAHMMIASPTGAADATWTELDVVRAHAVHVSVDPTYRGRVEQPTIPYVSDMSDVVAAISNESARFAFTGTLRIAFWDAVVTVEDADATHTYRAGQWNESATPAAPGIQTNAVRQVVWLELASTRLELTAPGPSALYGTGDRIDIAGALDAPDASGFLDAGDVDLNMDRRPLRLQGNIELGLRPGGDSPASSVQIDEPYNPYVRSPWSLSGTASGLAVDGRVIALDTSVVQDVRAVTVGAVATLVAAYLVYRAVPVFVGMRLARRDDDVALQGTRERTLEAVIALPGAHAGQVASHVGISRSTATYHLRILAAAGIVAIRRDGPTVRYFENQGQWDRDGDLLTVLLHARSRVVARAVADAPGMDQVALAKRTGLPRSTVSFHLRRLRHSGAVRSERPGGHHMKHYHPTLRLHAVLARLQQTELETTETALQGA